MPEHPQDYCFNQFDVSGSFSHALFDCPHLPLVRIRRPQVKELHTMQDLHQPPTVLNLFHKDDRMPNLVIKTIHGWSRRVLRVWYKATICHLRSEQLTWLWWWWRWQMVEKIHVKMQLNQREVWTDWAFTLVIRTRTTAAKVATAATRIATRVMRRIWTPANLPKHRNLNRCVCVWGGGRNNSTAQSHFGLHMVGDNLIIDFLWNKAVSHKNCTLWKLFYVQYSYQFDVVHARNYFFIDGQT